MRKLIALLAAASLCAGGLASPVSAQQQRGSDRGRDASRSDQASARQEMQAGRTMPLREIERRIIPQMKGSDYIGPEWDPTATAYRLKFMKEGQVTWVDVDARTGRILRIAK